MEKGTKNPFDKFFDDVEELKVTRDNEGILSVTGRATLSNTLYKITIYRNDPLAEDSTSAGEDSSGEDIPSKKGKKTSKKPLYTGTISIVSLESNNVLISEAKKRKKGITEDLSTKKRSELKSLYASITFRCNCADENIIASRLRRQVDKLYLENEAQLNAEWAKTMTPDQVTPSFAAEKYMDDYLSLTSGTYNPDLYDAKKRKIQKVFKLLPSIPFSKLSPREVSAILKRENVPSGNIELCHRFVDYLISRKKCTGKNPFPSESSKPISYERLNKNAFSSHEISREVFEKMFQLINNKISTVYCGIALLASGFTLVDLDDLKWGDIEFVPGYNDFAVIHIRRDQLIVAKHDFSRPAIPDTAMYLRKVYDKLCEEHGAEVVKAWYVVTTEHSKNKPLDHKALTEEVNNILVRAGYVGRLVSPGRPNSDQEPIPLSLLRTNYQRRLFSDAGLANDADTANFLSGILLESSTFINYESHTSPEALYRLYKVLKPISVEAPIKQPRKERETKNALIYTAAPKTNHEVVRPSGTIELKPGDKIIIRIPSGAHGHIDVSHHKS